MFAIELQSAQETGEENSAHVEASGRIIIGDFTETFRVPLGFWDESDDRRSWRRAFDVLQASPHSKSCLMTSMTDHRNSNFLSCWPMHREGEDISFHEGIIFLDEIKEPFDPATPWRYVGTRQIIDEDGNKVSEWVTS